ncbi:MAG: regulatory protein GemA [Candidatus Thiodiazotropha taylori]
MLNTICGVQTSADLGYRDRQAVIQHLKSKGWAPSPRGPQKSSDAQSRLIHHIWNSLADAGVVKHRSGLGSWLKTYTKHDHPNGTGWQRPEFLPKNVRRNVIEQLKKWAGRTGVKWQ